MFKKNPHFFFGLMLLFIILLKLTPIFTSDIQPWDEGMYAIRVNSIATFGDILDQSSHSVGGFYSAAHPPLLIWIGYILTSIFGDHSYIYKLIVFCFALLTLVFIYLAAYEIYFLVPHKEEDSKLKDQQRGAFFGILAAMIYAGNIIFHVFSERFQFDIPYSFFIISSFYFIILFLKSPKKKYLYITGILFGFCLMMKILVGFIIPIVLFAFYLISKDKTALRRFTFKNILLITITGLIIAAPWHIYMILNYGSAFLDYFFGFHIYRRAVEGIEQNVKTSGPLYHINYFLTIIPFSILAARKIFIDIRDFRKLDIYTKFIDVWFICGLSIITVFRTKLESYSFLILLPACFIIPALIYFHSDYFHKKRKYLAILLALNLLWYSTEDYRDLGKVYIAANYGNLLLFVGILLLTTAVLYFIYLYLINKFTPKIFLTYLIIGTFFISGFWYLYKRPRWENSYVLSGIKKEIVSKNIKEIAYIGFNYQRNPQLSYYFDGIDLGWKKNNINYRFIEQSSPPDSIASVIATLNSNTAILVERDGINRGVYRPSESFISDSIKLVTKSPGYEFYIK